MFSFRKATVLILLLLIPAMIFAFGNQERSGDQSAQGSETQGATRPNVDQGSTAQSGTAQSGTSGQTGTANQQMQAGSPTGERFTKLVNQTVANQNGDLKGNVKDVVLTTNGDITHLVVSLGATTAAPAGTSSTGQAPTTNQSAAAAGTQPGATTGAQPGTATDQTGAAGQAAVNQPAPGGDEYIVPIDRFTFGTAEQAITVNASASDLQSYSKLQDNKLPAAVSGEAAGGQHILASNLKDFKVRNAQNQDLGGISDIMLDLQTKKVAYIGLGAGGFLGIGEKVFAVPMSAITGLNVEQKQVMVNITEEQLRQNPGIEGDNWPAQASSWGATAPSSTSGSEKKDEYGLSGSNQ